MKIFFTIVILMSFILPETIHAKSNPKSMTLVRNGRPEAAIVIAKKPTKAAQFGAYELQSHIKQITGTILPIVKDSKKVTGTKIYVGDSAAVKKLGIDCAKLKSQEYLIRFLPDAIILAGKDKQDFGKPVYDYIKNINAVNTWASLYDETGTMYAVYDFLEKYCGVKWLNPTDYGTIVPKEKTLTVAGSDIKRKPHMVYRGGAAAYDASQRYNENGGLWYYNQNKEYPEYNNRAYGKVYKKYKNPRQRTMGRQAQNRLFMFRHKAGGEYSQCNHSFYDFYNRFWEKSKDPRTAKLFVEKRPELFAKGYTGKPPQLCYGCDETVAQVVKDIRNYFDNGGTRWGKNFYALEPMDNNSFCKCKICAAQYEPARRTDSSEHSTYWFSFVNRVAKEIKKSHPDKKISTLAYMSHEGLPTGFKLEDNVVVHFCLSANRMPYDKKTLAKQIGRIREWREKAPDVPMYLWLYGCFPGLIAKVGKFHCFPGYYAHEVKRQYDLFKKLKIKGVFYDGFTGDVDNYVSYKLMDDPDRDVNELADEYFSAYGAAGKPLKEMYEIIEERYCNPGNYPQQNGAPYSGHQNVKIAWDSLGNAETMQKLQRCMDQAYAAAKTEREKNLVRMWDDAVWSYMKKGRKKYVERSSSPIPEINVPKVADANGNVNKVDWSKAVSLGDKWYRNGGNIPAISKLSGRICHDGKYLYLELIDQVDPKKLHVSPMICCYDDWEIFIATQRAQPYRQFLAGPTGMVDGYSYGEVNWRQTVPSSEYTKKGFGMTAVSDTKSGKWVTRLAFPLNKMLIKPVKPGDDIYMNIMRVKNPKLCADPAASFGIDTWVPYTTVFEVDRLGKVHLEK